MKIPNVTIQQLLEAGVHLGHKTLRWNPKMKKYIFGKRDSIHIIDLTQTLELTNEALKKVYNTIKSSDFDGSFSWQSASFPGKLATSKALFLRVNSRAFLAASLANADSTIFDMTIFASAGFSSNQSEIFSLRKLSTSGLTSEETNLSLV